MDKQINKIKNNSKQINLDYSIPSYNYVSKLPTPAHHGVGASGDVSTLFKDLIYMGRPIVPMYFGVGSNDPKKYPGNKGYYNTGGALGNYYRIPAGYDKKGKQKWMCIDNIPRIPVIDGIIPGMMKDMYDINPLVLLNSFSKNPDKNIFKECFSNLKKDKNNLFNNFLVIIILIIALSFFHKLFHF